ncbi:MAG: hypothetical protein BGN88_14245 [Clostridiales bacterium 43-6]|nr:MAG: hypothetical protein BGN88_14245 [Clostridiales bacterium 43-6]
MTAGLLAIFLGFLGVHNFYLGYFGKGLAQILITVFSLGFAAWISWIWAVVEGVLLLSGRKKTDSNGFPLR